MKSAGKIVFALIVCFALMTATGLAKQKMKYSGFLKSYPTFEKGPKGGADFVYFKEGVDYKQYNRVMIDPVVFFISDDAKYRGIQPDELNKLSNAFHKAMSDALGDAYPLSKKPDKDVLRLRLAITDVLPSEPKATITTPMQVGMSYLNMGKASMEAELLDSTSNKRVAAAIDTKAGDMYAVTEGMSKWEDVEKAFQFWAKRLRIFLDEAHGR